MNNLANVDSKIKLIIKTNVNKSPINILLINIIGNIEKMIKVLSDKLIGSYYIKENLKNMN